MTSKNGIPIYGLDKELAQKAADKYDVALEAQAKAWLTALTGVSLDSTPGPDALHASLKDGVVLCKAIHALNPKACTKIATSKLAFKQMENIAMFLREAEVLGCPQYELFQTVDLFEAKNMGQVVQSLFSLSRQARRQGLGPAGLSALGPKLSEKHEVHFTEEQLRKGRAIPSQQMGFTGGATQRSMGVSFGGNRDIVRSNESIHKDVPSQQTAGYLKGPKGESFGGRRDILTHSIDKPLSGREAAARKA